MTCQADKRLVIPARTAESCAAIGADVNVIEAIFEPAISLVVFRRPIEFTIAQYLREASPGLRSGESRHCVTLASPATKRLFADFPAGPGREALIADYLWQLELFTIIADAREVGVRTISTREQTCPRFHVDKVQVRQICTWQGVATEWLQSDDVDRRFLGSRSGGKSDEASGLLRPGACINRMGTFDVGLMKGEMWPDNTGRGLVHRSPDPGAVPRVMMTFDALA